MDMTGQIVAGTYELRQRIGAGPRADVYEGSEIATGLRVAVKIFRPSRVFAPSDVERFRREIGVLCRLRHPNIARVTDRGEAPSGCFFLAMEYVQGRTLAQLLAGDARNTEERAVDIAEQVLAALDEAHRQSCPHRDLKPANVMVEEGPGDPGLVKVLDFGIAHLFAPSSDVPQNVPLDFTPGYTSPEQLCGRPASVQSDLYAVGAILYEMLASEHPFQGGSVAETVRRQLAGPPVPLSERCNRASGALERVVMAALAVDPAERPSSAAEMREHLLAARGRERGRGAP